MLITSETFKMVTENIKSSSNFLNNYELFKSSDNLKMSKSIAWNAVDHIVPVLQTKSCIPFVNKMAEFIAESTSTNVSKFKT